MERQQNFPFADNLTAGSRRLLALFMVLFLALVWPNAATAVETAKPGADQSDNQQLHWTAPAIALQAEELIAVPEPTTDPPGEERSPPAVPWVEPDRPRNARRTPDAKRQEADAGPSASGRHAETGNDLGDQAQRQPAGSGQVRPYAEADDDSGGVPPPCPAPRWEPGLWAQPFANRLEARGEGLLWWGKGNQVPALVTTAPSTVARDQAGVLGVPGTVILFGDSGLNDGARSGERVTLDYWLTRDHSLGLEAEYFGLGDSTAGFQASSNSQGIPVLARPFTNTQTGLPDSGIIALPNVQTGAVWVDATNGFQGVEALLRHTWYRGDGAHLDFLVGYRYLRLSDDLDIEETETFIDPQGVVPVGSTLALWDHFSTLNEFQGADLGLSLRLALQPLERGVPAESRAG